MPHHYAICGLILETERPFATPLLPARGAVASSRVVHFVERVGPIASPAHWELERVFEGDGEPWMSLGRLGQGFLLRVHGEADFLVDAQGTEIQCVPETGIAPASIEQLLLDHILPQVLHLRGKPCFHASAVALARGVVAFVGRSGSGKSTLAASFPEGRLVSDDCLVASLGEHEVLAEASYPSVRLWDETARALLGEGVDLPLAAPRSCKVRVALPPARGPLPLRSIYLLDSTDTAAALVRLRPRDAVVRLAEHLHRLDPADRGRLTEELSFLEALATRVPVSVLAYPRRYEALAVTRGIVEADQASRG